MKATLVFTVLGILLTKGVFAQSDDHKDTTQNYTVNEVMPEFKGGYEGLLKFIGKHLKYPKAARKNNINGWVHVGFTVGLTGDISDVEVVNGLSPECDEEAVRVVKLFPRWKPGKRNGDIVPVRFVLPIRFRN
jgi:periplasmic protein TonB